MIITCEFCGSTDLRSETAMILSDPFTRKEFHRVKCCNCGKILFKDYTETVEEATKKKSLFGLFKK